MWGGRPRPRPAPGRPARRRPPRARGAAPRRPAAPRRGRGPPPQKADARAVTSVKQTPHCRLIWILSGRIAVGEVIYDFTQLVGQQAEPPAPPTPYKVLWGHLLLSRKCGNPQVRVRRSTGLLAQGVE